MNRSLSQNAPAELWVITTYFNFHGYKRRLANYRFFRQHLNAPLLTVELSAEPSFALGPGDADILIQCNDGDVMWQKERLLNHGFARLPGACRYVVWLDCDLLFENGNWMEQVKAALADAPLLQPFGSVLHAPAGIYPAKFSESPGWMEQPSVCAMVNSGVSFATCARRMMQRSAGTAASGMAWAARRSLMEKHGLFDASIIGGGDTALACAAFGRPEIAMELHKMNVWQRRAYLNWARPFHQEVKGNVSHVPGRVIHLWHGEMQDRKPAQRHVGLCEHNFDPARDIAVGPFGAWRWASEKPGLHSYLKNYFASRFEDGKGL
jgi:hypothetical protein